MNKTMSDINHEVWSLHDSAMEYARDDTIFPPEETILRQFNKELTNGALLDIGVGAGRTTRFLQPICGSYTGIDYSPEMLDSATKKFPGTDFRHMDARDLSAFKAKSFDVVWFSYNGIDYVSHKERLKILKEVHRVLRLGGLFIFSSHNRDAEVRHSYHLRNMKLHSNPYRFARSVYSYVRGIYHSVGLVSQEIRMVEYAILNDSAQGYQLLTYYISREQQEGQLEEQHFTNVLSVNMQGEVIDKNSTAADGYSIHYVARAVHIGTSEVSATL